jgi:hypothetical protein
MKVKELWKFLLERPDCILYHSEVKAMGLYIGREDGYTLWGIYYAEPGECEFLREFCEESNERLVRNIEHMVLEYPQTQNSTICMGSAFGVVHGEKWELFEPEVSPDNTLRFVPDYSQEIS